MSETFRKSWRGHIQSSLGYTVRIAGRVGLDYQDEHGAIRVDSEVMASPSREIVVYTGSIPDTPERPRHLTVERLRRALESDGWRTSWEDPNAP
jgi:hypothetical protein